MSKKLVRTAGSLFCFIICVLMCLSAGCKSAHDDAVDRIKQREQMLSEVATRVIQFSNSFARPPTSLGELGLTGELGIAVNDLVLFSPKVADSRHVLVQDNVIFSLDGHDYRLVAYGDGHVARLLIDPESKGGAQAP